MFLLYVGQLLLLSNHILALCIGRFSYAVAFPVVLFHDYYLVYVA